MKNCTKQFMLFPGISKELNLHNEKKWDQHKCAKSFHAILKKTFRKEGNVSGSGVTCNVKFLLTRNPVWIMQHREASSAASVHQMFKITTFCDQSQILNHLHTSMSKKKWELPEVPVYQQLLADVSFEKRILVAFSEKSCSCLSCRTCHHILSESHESLTVLSGYIQLMQLKNKEQNTRCCRKFLG